MPQLNTQRLVDLFSNNARRIFSLRQNIVDQKEVADLTIFERETEFIYSASSIKSKSKNSPYIDKQLKGKVIGIINKDKVYLNETTKNEG
jgi:dihydroorotase